MSHYSHIRYLPPPLHFSPLLSSHIRVDKRREKRENIHTYTKKRGEKQKNNMRKRGGRVEIEGEKN